MLPRQAACRPDERSRKYLTTEVFTVQLNRLWRTVCGLMTDHRVRHLPVQEGEKIIGVISMAM